MNLEKKVVLCLNRNWQPIEIKTIEKAIVAMNSDRCSSKKPDMALNIEYSKNDNGEWNFNEPILMEPLSWEEWIKLPCHNYHETISTINMKIRVPNVLIHSNYDKSKMVKPSLSKESIFERDGYIDQYTGKPLRKSDATVDHVIPKSHGGKNSWSNLVTCHRDLNSIKGNKFNWEIGLKLIKTPKEPVGIPFVATLNSVKNPPIDWIPFLVKA